MIEALEQLETKRRRLYQEMDALGDFRPGIISVNFRMDLEATELSIRHTMHNIGGVLLEKLLNSDSGVSNDSNEEGKEDLKELAGIDVTTKAAWAESGTESCSAWGRRPLDSRDR